MADNVTLDPGTGGSVIRTKDRTLVETQIVALDLNPAGAESLMAGVMPVSDNAGSLTVDGTVTANAGTGPWPVTDNAGSLTVDAPAANPVFVRLSDGAAAITALPVTDNAGSLTVDNGGTFAVQIAANSSINNAQVAGTTVDTNSGNKSAGTQRVILASDQPVVPVSDNAGSLTVDAPVGTPVFATVTPSATGGWSKIKYAAQTTTVVKPKGTAGTFGGYYVYNPNATVAYIQVFDLATATTVTLGTTVPDMIFGIPPTSAANLEITAGVNMALGMQLACTTTALGSTAPGTGLDLTVLFK